jgi:GNAT superfamily N-acetyltransferase
MIECLRDNEGRIVAVCEWLLFKDGVLARDGDVMFVGELEINPEFRGKGVIKHFINTLYRKNPQAKRLVYLREYKYPDRSHRDYTREQIAKRIGA